MSKRKTKPYQVRYLLSWLLLGLMRLLSFLPLRVLYYLGSGLGDVLRFLIPSRKKIARRNLALCFPEKSDSELDALTKENFRNTARLGLFTGFFGGPLRLDFAHASRSDILSVLKDILDTGRGVILLAPTLSLSNWGVFFSR